MLRCLFLRKLNIRRPGKKLRHWYFDVDSTCFLNVRWTSKQRCVLTGIFNKDIGIYMICILYLNYTIHPFLRWAFSLQWLFVPGTHQVHASLVGGRALSNHNLRPTRELLYDLKNYDIDWMLKKKKGIQIIMCYRW